MNKPRLAPLLIGLGLLGVILFSSPALAQTPPTSGTTTPPTSAGMGFLAQMGTIVGCGNTDPSKDLGSLVTFSTCTASRYATAIAVVIIMVAGVMYIFSGSNPALAGTAKAMIVTTITGIVAMYSISLVLSILISTGIVSKGSSSTSPTVTPTPARQP